MKTRTTYGFTILEIILATTLFALISVAVFGVFRTGTRAYRDAQREAAVLQRTRFIFDTLESDIANLYYMDETSYNIQAEKMIKEYEKERLEAEEDNDWDAFEQKYGPREDDREADNDPNYVGNPFEQVRMIDLQFAGEDREEADGMSFAIYNKLQVGGNYYLAGLERVHYTVDNGVLIRSVESVESNPRTWTGEVIEKENPPQHMIVAEGVVTLDFKYAFWVDNQWYETDAWNSANRQLRNPQYLLGEYEFEEDDDGRIVFGPGAPGWNDYLNDLENQPLDRVPAYIRVRLQVADPESPARTHTFERIFRVPNSQETWFINTNLEEEEQEMERQERDQEFTPVYPGALRKESR
ncbi:hypothetical protein KQI84_05085 [bacterium]|nr:hypothetical protein [bacterium]